MAKKKKEVDPSEDYSVKEAKSSLFDVLSNLSESKDNRWFEFERGYSAFMINRYLSMHPDTLFFAMEMNKRNLTNREHYEFLLHAIPKRRRFFKYYKGEALTALEEQVMETLNVTRHKAKASAKLLNKLHEEV